MTKKKSGNSFLAKLLGPIITVVVGVAIVWGLWQLRAREEVAPEVVPPVVNVSVMEIIPIEQLIDTFVLKGDVEPWTTLHLSAETAGRIADITVRQGDAVAPGAVLVKLDDDLLQAAADQAQAKADFDAREVKRFSDARGGGVATEMEMDLARSASIGSRAAMELAAAHLRQTVIRAPDRIHDPVCGVDQIGRISDLPVEIGEYVDPGKVVVEIVETRCLRVVVHVPELDVRFLEIGQETDIVVEALSDRKVRGTIHFIEAVADPSTRTFRTEIIISNTDGAIRPGMFVRVALVRQAVANAIMIPFDAAAPLERDYEVFISRDGKAHRRKVGFRQDVTHGKMMLAIDPVTGEGLTAGDRLIIQGQRLLGDGQAIIECPTPEKLLEELGLPTPPTETPAPRPTAPKE